MPYRPFRLTVKCPLFVLGLLLVVIWGLACYLNQTLKRDLEHLFSAQQFSAVSVIAASIERETRLRLKTLADLAQALGAVDFGAPEEVDRFLRNNVMIGALFNGGLCVLDPEGICLADAPRIPGRAGLNLGEREYFTAALTGREPVVGAPRKDRLSGRPQVALSAPIRDASDRVKGALVGITYLDADNYIGRIVAAYEGESGGVLVIDPLGGRFVAATDPDRIFAAIPAEGVNRMHDRYMAGYEGSGVAANSRGVEELSSGRRVPATGWFAVAVLPVEAAFAPVTAFQRTILGAALAVSVILPWLAAVVMGRWLEPLRKTTSALREMTAGRRALAALPATAHDEVGELIESFNELVRDIEDRKKATAALRESEERYRVLLDLSQDAVFVHRDGVMTLVNRSALRLFGAEREGQLLGLPWAARIHPDFREIVGRRFQAVEESGGSIVLPPVEQRYLRLDGSSVEVEVTSSAITLGESRAVLSVARDITQRKIDEARFKIVLAQQEALLDNALVGIVLLEERVITRCNRRFEELFGYGEDEMLGQRTEILYPTKELYESTGERAYAALADGGTHVEELWFKRKDGSRFWGELHGKALDARRPQAGSVWIFADLTERKGDQERSRLAASVFDNTTEGIMITDTDRAILAVNSAFTEVTGYTDQEVIGKNPSLLSSGRQPPEFYRQMWETLRREGKWRGEIWNRRKSGEVYPELLSIGVVRDGEGHATHYVGVFSDISAQKLAEQQLSFLAHHDPLTGLPNRALFNDRLTHAIHRAARENARLAVMFIDLDRFKDVNDTLGHHLGDQLLQSVAQQFRQAVRAADTLARLGGDEFALLVEDIGETLDAVVVARKLLGIFARPFALAEHDIHVSSSIGISLYPADGREAHELVKNADAAMYRAKAKGRNGYACYAREMTEYAAERLRLEATLRRSIDNGELRLYFQPQVDLASGALLGAEALVRWHHPEMGLVPPAKFVPLAEETGFIAPLGEWVLREACTKASAWLAQGYSLPGVSVNLSIKQFERGNMVGLVADVLAETGLPAGYLEMEITESFIAKGEEALRFVEGLRLLGVHLSVDDFGTGYSCLAYLKRLPLQTLKIDKSFVMDIGRDPNNETIVHTIIALARSLGLTVVAEGVETAEQSAFLVREGCRIGQGYHYSPPLPEEEFVARWLRPSRDDAAGCATIADEASHPAPVNPS